MGALDRIRGRRLPEVSEYRAPTVATQATRYQAPGRPMVPQGNAEQAVRWGYYANTFVFACAKAIAQDLSRMAIRVGDPDTGDHDPRHPLVAHLGPPPGGPNPATSARKLLAWSAVQWLITGRIGWEVETGSRGQPRAAWPLPASRLKAIPSQGGTGYFDAFEFGPEHNPTRLPADRVFYTWDPSPDDWREPESRLQAMRLDVSVAVMSDRYDYAFLRNDARPAAVVVHEAFATADERRAWRDQFRARHEGPDAANRLAFAETEGGEGGVAGALDVKVLGFSQRDAQSIERYASKVRAICVGMGVPLSRLGDASGRTFSNADAEGVFYWQNTIWPLALDFADAMSIQLLPRYGRPGNGAVFFDWTSVPALNAGRNIAQASVKDLLDADVIDWQEARTLVGVGRRDPDDRPDNGTQSSPTVMFGQPPAAIDPGAQGDPGADPFGDAGQP